MAYYPQQPDQQPPTRHPRSRKKEEQSHPYQQPGWTFQQPQPAPFAEEPAYTEESSESKPRRIFEKCKRTWNGWGKGKKAAAIVVALSLLGAAAGDEDENTQQEPPAPSPVAVVAHVTMAPTATPLMSTSTPEVVRAAATLPPLVFNTLPPDKPTATPRPTATPKPTNTKVPSYTLNTKTKKYHKDTCYTIEDMDEGNKVNFNGTSDRLRKMGYEPCEKCNPW